jgi:acetyl-CoA synthetase
MIKARIPAQNPGANLSDYAAMRQSFHWSDMEKEMGLEATSGTNIIAESIDKWAAHPEKSSHPALIFENNGQTTAVSYGQLRDISAQWATFFIRHGLTTGDCLMIFLPPCREFFFAMAACARAGIIFCPVFASSGYHELETRLTDTAPRGILTSPDLIETIPPESAAAIGSIFLTRTGPGIYTNEVDISDKPDSLPTDYPPCRVAMETPLYIIYTSGSTSPPKGIIHSHGDMVGIYASAKWALDLSSGDVLWTDADPAWVTGTVYGAFAPWLCGVTSVISETPFTAANCYRTLETNSVTVWYTTPHTIRTLMEAGEDLPARYDLRSLRHLATVGSPLMPDLFYWVKKHLGSSPHDNWWMSETGIICLANFPSLDIKPGAIGKPLPGITAAILDDNGQELPFLSLGQLALKSGWPGMLQGLWRDQKRYGDYFINGWFITGDIALQDEEGYFYHQGRLDDILKTVENRTIGPFEVEQALCRHPAVAESAVITRGEDREAGTSALKAFVIIKKGFLPSRRLNHEIRMFLKASIAPDILIDDITFIESLPRTRSGKLLRRVLRAWELGLPGGDATSMAD